MASGEIDDNVTGISRSNLERCSCSGSQVCLQNSTEAAGNMPEEAFATRLRTELLPGSSSLRKSENRLQKRVLSSLFGRCMGLYLEHDVIHLMDLFVKYNLCTSRKTCWRRQMNMFVKRNSRSNTDRKSQKMCPKVNVEDMLKLYFHGYQDRTNAKL